MVEEKKFLGILDRLTPHVMLYCVNRMDNGVRFPEKFEIWFDTSKFLWDNVIHGGYIAMAHDMSINSGGHWCAGVKDVDIGLITIYENPAALRGADYDSDRAISTALAEILKNERVA